MGKNDAELAVEFLSRLALKGANVHYNSTQRLPSTPEAGFVSMDILGLRGEIFMSFKFDAVGDIVQFTTRDASQYFTKEET